MTPIRWLIVGLIFVTALVAIGFYRKAHEDFRTNLRLEPKPTMRFHVGDTILLREPVPICETKEICSEAQRMTRIVEASEKKHKTRSLEMAESWFEQMNPQIKMADEIEILEVDESYSKVRIAAGPDADYEGYAFTIAIEEHAAK